MVVSNRKGPATIKVLFLMYLMVTKLVTVFQMLYYKLFGLGLGSLAWGLKTWHLPLETWCGIQKPCHGPRNVSMCLWKLGPPLEACHGPLETCHGPLETCHVPLETCHVAFGNLQCAFGNFPWAFGNLAFSFGNFACAFGNLAIKGLGALAWKYLLLKVLNNLFLYKKLT